jgi:hypothetical protein
MFQALSAHFPQAARVKIRVADFGWKMTIIIAASRALTEWQKRFGRLKPTSECAATFEQPILNVARFPKRQPGRGCCLRLFISPREDRDAP